MGDDQIGVLVKRLSRPHGSGGRVIERSVILAEGASSGAILGWISEHQGVGESSARSTPAGGLHGMRAHVPAAAANAPAKRFVLPAGAFE